MHNESLKLESVIKKLGQHSRLVLHYLIFNNHIEVLTPKMVSRMLKKVHSINIGLKDAQNILSELSHGNKATLYRNLYFLDKEIDLMDYLEMDDQQKSLVSCYFHPTDTLTTLRKNAN